MHNITVKFGTATANDNVSLDVCRNEILAIVGENGAGKTTLMNTLYGLVRPQSGSIILNGKPYSRVTPKTAIAAGIGMVHQHFMLVPSFTAAENIALGNEPLRRGVFLDTNQIIANARALSEQYGLVIDPNARICNMSVGMQQRVEILKILSRGADVLILDEPTAVLTLYETRELFSMLRVFIKNTNKACVLITHKLYEVIENSDRVAVMRAGKLIGIEKTSATTQTELARMMIGRDITTYHTCAPTQKTSSVLAPLIEIRGLQVKNAANRIAIQDMHLKLHEGEILGIAGVEGNGQTELCEVITGLRPASKGDIYLNGIRINGLNVKSIRALGVAHIPENGPNTGVSKAASIAENLIAGKHKKKQFAIGSIHIKQKAIREYARNLVKKFDIRGGTENTEQPVHTLSGGNMQKVIIGRELSFDNARAFIISQPTRGLDIGASDMIHSQIINKRNEGAGILLVSADLDEILKLSDRIITVYEGSITGEFDTRTATRENVGAAMLGSIGGSV